MNRSDSVECLITAHPKLWAALDWCVCGAATLVALGLHILYLNHAGGLWRDEASDINLATLPSWAELWRMIAHDSFPALSFSLLRCWCALGLGNSDFGLRCFGFLVGLLVLASLWVNARSFRLGAPCISLGLLALNSTLLRSGDALRGYGLGCFFIMLTMGAVWRMVQSPGPRWFALASLVGILSVQTLYQNAFLLLAICAAGFLVCICRQRLRAGLGVLAIGAPAALSLLPYLGIIRRSQEWYVLEKSGFDPNVVFSNLYEAVGNPCDWIALVWMGLAGLAVAGGIVAYRRIGKSGQSGREDMTLFASLTLVLGILFFLFLLWASKLRTQSWYWLPMVCLAAVCLEVAVRGWLGGRRAWSLVYLLLMVWLPLPTAVTLARIRQTNMDLVAATARQMAGSSDFIIVYPWYLGVSFHRYYKGTAAWTTLPDISDLSLHRYDLLKAKMTEKAPIASVLERVGKTLQSGNKVWIVGWLPVAEPGETRAPDLPPAPSSKFGWQDAPYNYVWGRQTLQFITDHKAHTAEVPVSSKRQIGFVENAPLVKVW